MPRNVWRMTFQQRRRRARPARSEHRRCPDRPRCLERFDEGRNSGRPGRLDSTLIWTDSAPEPACRVTPDRVASPCSGHFLPGSAQGRDRSDRRGNDFAMRASHGDVPSAHAFGHRGDYAVSPVYQRSSCARPGVTRSRDGVTDVAEVVVRTDIADYIDKYQYFMSGCVKCPQDCLRCRMASCLGTLALRGAAGTCHRPPGGARRATAPVLCPDLSNAGGRVREIAVNGHWTRRPRAFKRAPAWFR